jgi:hypothetical protein
MSRYPGYLLLHYSAAGLRLYCPLFPNGYMSGWDVNNHPVFNYLSSASICISAAPVAVQVLSA